MEGRKERNEIFAGRSFLSLLCVDVLRNLVYKYNDESSKLDSNFSPYVVAKLQTKLLKFA